MLLAFDVSVAWPRDENGSPRSDHAPRDDGHAFSSTGASAFSYVIGCWI